MAGYLLLFIYSQVQVGKYINLAGPADLYQHPVASYLISSGESYEVLSFYVFFCGDGPGAFGDEE